MKYSWYIDLCLTVVWPEVFCPQDTFDKGVGLWAVSAGGKILQASWGWRLACHLVQGHWRKASMGQVHVYADTLLLEAKGEKFPW